MGKQATAAAAAQIPVGEATDIGDAAATTTQDQAAAPPAETATIVKPSVGRRLWFRCNGNDDARRNLGVFDEGQPCDAGVLYVWNDRMVNVNVTGPSGVQASYTSVLLLQPGDEQPAPPQFYVEWMPFQVNSAAKVTP